MSEEVRELWLLRHGQSLGNVANDAARVNPVDVLDIADRDMDVPLSDLGRRQADAVGRWLATEASESRPDVVLSSTYRRAVETANIVIGRAGLDVELVLDERLREREFGVLDLLTHQGIVARFPEEATRRQRIGKFYYRPPGGESWVDVALRLRSFLDSVARECSDRQLLVVTHEVPIIVFRYLLQRLDESQALELSRSARLANCSLTTFRRDHESRLRLERDAWTASLEQHDAPITDEPDAAVASR